MNQMINQDLIRMSGVVRKQRESLNLSQKDVAKLSKTSLSNIKKVESGTFGDMRVRTLLRILDVLSLKIVLISKDETVLK
jgi:predicted transcriptional regulator